MNLLADANVVVKKKLVPKGTSDYQAAWIFESDEACNLK
jgi:hypothetical protein